jgi:arabinose-5-phosphate isomerase
MTDILQSAREVLAIEAEGILRLQSRLGEGFERAVRLILESPGKVITTGIGKSGIIARKIMATLNSTGTTSIFLHPVEALHGDLGMVSPGDVVLAISHSGETGELVDLLPVLRDNGAVVVAMTGGLSSALAKESDVVIDCGVEREACPLGLAPTASTTAALAVGDALAVVLIQKRRFNAEDFRRTHPGGRLGEHLSLKVREVMLTGERAPRVSPADSGDRLVEVLHRGDLGTVLVAEGDRLAGIFTDGDLRRLVVAGQGVAGSAAGELMTPDPATVDPEATAAEALHLMEERLITALPVVSAGGRLEGVVHLHDLLGRGRVSFKALAREAC